MKLDSSLRPSALDRLVFAAPGKTSRIVLWTISLLVGCLFAWATIGKLDVVTVSEGRLVPRSLTKTVQATEGGVLTELLIAEGDRVREGQVVARMDRTLAGADHKAVSHELSLKRLTLRRIDAELAGRVPVREAGDDVLLFAQVLAQAESKRRAVQDGVAQERAMLERATREREAADETLQKLHAVLPAIEENASAFEQLQQRGFVSPVTARERQRERIEKNAEIRAQRATAGSLSATIAAQAKKLDLLQSSYRSELRTERTQVIADLARLEGEVKKAEFRSQVLELRAPQAGTVKELATTTRGAVLQAGTVLASVVPQDDPLVAEVRIRNEDIGFVQVGGPVRIKVAAFPFQKYGLLEGRIRQIAPDATTDTKTPLEPERFPFKAIIELDTTVLHWAGRALPLAAGMTVQAEIRQGRRTVMEYLLSPVQRVAFEAARER